MKLFSENSSRFTDRAELHMLSVRTNTLPWTNKKSSQDELDFSLLRNQLELISRSTRLPRVIDWLKIHKS